MVIEGVTFPNLNDGYKTTVEFPFKISTLANNTISIWDAGNFYDKYSCTGKMVLTGPEMDSLFNIYNNTRRGQIVTLTNCNSTGFYPFGPAIGFDGYDVWIDEPKNLGMTDSAGKRFTIELTFKWQFPNSGGASTIIWNNPFAYCKDGNLDFANYTEVIFPQNGFKPKKGHGVAVQNYKGPTFYGVNLPSKDNEWNQSSFELTLRREIASNLIYNIINSYRALDIPITGADNYYIFGRDQGDNTAFSVKLSGPKMTIVHKKYDDFTIKFDVVKV